MTTVGTVKIEDGRDQLTGQITGSSTGDKVMIVDYVLSAAVSRCRSASWLP